MKTIIEPFRIKSVEPLRKTTRAEREKLLEQAGFNLFQLHSGDILIDLLTDSGTSAMSTAQWAAMMRGDESYAGSESFFRLKARVEELTGFRHVIPTHQGRAAERILFTVMCKAGQVVPNNTHFDTTRANLEFTGARAIDLPLPEAADTQARLPFKGNMHVPALEALISETGAANIPLVMLTVTNNSGGGQPVSMANLRAVREVTSRHGIPLYLDACRFAENAYFIQQQEPGFERLTPKQIAQAMFSYADGCTFSAKKDAFANIGGLLCTNDDRLAEQERDLEAWPAATSKPSRWVSRKFSIRIIWSTASPPRATWAGTSPIKACPSSSRPAATRSTSTQGACCRTSRATNFRVRRWLSSCTATRAYGAWRSGR